jgi:predicted TIM-barrel fold metal-dependent hydrolase
MERFDYEVIDAQTHIGRFPGHVKLHYPAEELVGCMEREGVAFTLCSSASATTVGQAYGNREMRQAVERFPERLGLLIWINPIDPEWEADATAHAERGALGIKLHPMLDTYSVDAESLGPVFVFARRHALPIVTHAESRPGSEQASAERYEPLARSFDDVTLVLYHFNAGRPIPGILMAKRFPNVYVDTCFVPREAIEIGLDTIGPSKILFGTDAPLFFDVGRAVPGADGPPRRSFRDCARDVEELCASTADRDLVMAGNARRLFKLPAREPAWRS